MTARRVLFVGEAVTLAHVARPHWLARGLAARGHTPIMAVDPRYASLCAPGDWQTESIRSIPTAQFLRALAAGSPVYDLATLNAYVEDDLALLRRIRPEVVVGDFRLSLSVSARLLGIPYVNITNACWSQYARPRWYMPALPGWRHLPPALGDTIFRTFRRVASHAHSKAFEACRVHHGLPRLGLRLAGAYTDGDFTLYADLPEVVPLFDPAPNHRHLGLMDWAPDLPLPDWWHGLDTSAGLIYVTLGSSGESALLPAVIEGLAGLGLPLVVATAGAPVPASLPAGVHAAPYLPGDRVAQHSKLVVCNGGSATSHQALARGVPVLALPTNLDQFLNSGYLESAGVARWLRPQAVSAQAIGRAAAALLGDADVAQRGAAIARSAARYDAAAVLDDAIDALLSPRSEVLPPRRSASVDAAGRSHSQHAQFADASVSG